MSTVPKWHLAGDWFDICSCDIPCPCDFAQAPTNNACMGMLAWHIREGHYGEVGLEGLNLVALAASRATSGPAKPSSGWASSSTNGPTSRSARPCRRSFRARPAGGRRHRQHDGRVQRRGVYADRLRGRRGPRLLAGRDSGAGVGRAEALSGPTTPPGQRVQTINPPGSEVGPGKVATWGSSVKVRTEGFGFKWTGRRPLQQAHPVRLDRTRFRLTAGVHQLRWRPRPRRAPAVSLPQRRLWSRPVYVKPCASSCCAFRSARCSTIGKKGFPTSSMGSYGRSAALVGASRFALRKMHRRAWCR